ncbi:hypothetical protein ABGV42_00580 [Paenibacillus pabuli]|uniref:hypothetical protein n=1 Tax=Paenibacillus pabuli TaxID=1472 RepID=UPI003242D064
MELRLLVYEIEENGKIQYNWRPYMTENGVENPTKVLDNILGDNTKVRTVFDTKAYTTMTDSIYTTDPDFDVDDDGDGATYGTVLLYVTPFHDVSAYGMYYNEGKFTNYVDFDPASLSDYIVDDSFLTFIKTNHAGFDAVGEVAVESTIAYFVKDTIDETYEALKEDFSTITNYLNLFPEEHRENYRYLLAIAAKLGFLRDLR